MKRLIDKGIVLICCVAALLVVPFSTTFVVGMLACAVVSSLFEVTSIPRPARWALLVAYLAVSLFVPAFLSFVPLIAYDCLRTAPWPLRLGWLVPLLVGFGTAPLLSDAVFPLIVSGVASGLSFRTSQMEQERAEYIAMRDALQEASLSLEEKNRDLQDKQDYEVTFATLSERSRIAREIHDNVGHLLTRSVLQVEAMQVVHQDDQAVKAELAQIGTTLHEALDSVRASVHDLHDDSFDLRTQLMTICRSEKFMDVEVDFQADEVPAPVGYCFVAIVRESLANAAKHGDADRVRVSVIEYPAFYRLTVHDNGTMAPDDSDGSPPAKLSRGIGMQTMEDRTRALGGIFRADFDRGFRIFVTIPKETT